MTQATLLDIVEVRAGSEVIRDHAIGEMTLELYDSSDFSDSGTLEIEGVQYPYTAKDDDTDILTLGSALTVAVPEDTEVYLFPATITKRAMVQISDQDDAEFARVPHHLVPALEAMVRDDTDEDIVVITEEDDEWVITDVLGTEYMMGGEYVDPSTMPPPPTSDGVPPASSPTPSATGLKGFIMYRWPAVLNNDPVRYQLHISADAGFTPVFNDSATMIAETSATMFAVGELPGGVPLQYEEVDSAGNTVSKLYYMRIFAYDEDGVAPVGNPGSGSMSKVAAEDIAANSITALQLAGLIVLGSTITSRSLDASGQPTGPGVDLTPQGLYSFGPNGEPRVDMPNAPGTPTTFRGDAWIDNLTVQTLTTLKSTSLASAATMTLEQGVVNPVQKPTAVAGYQTASFNMSGRNIWSSCMSPDGQYLFWWDADNKKLIRKTVSTGAHTEWTPGVNAAPYGIDWPRAVGLVHDGTNLLMFVNWTDGVVGMIIQIKPTTMAQTGQREWVLSAAGVHASGNGNRQHAVFYGGTDVNGPFFWVAMTSLSDNKTRFFKWSVPNDTPDPLNGQMVAATYRQTITSTYVYPDAPHIAGVWRGDVDGNGTDVFVMVRRGMHTSASTTIVIDPTTGGRLDVHEWPLGINTTGVGGLWKTSDTRFQVFDTTGILTYYENGTNWYGNVMTDGIYAAYSWTQNADQSGYQTMRSPVASLTMNKRSRITLNAPDMPQGVAGIRWYLSTTNPGSSYQNMQYTNITYAIYGLLAIVTGVVFIGNANQDPGTNSFPNASPAQFRSAAVLGSNPAVDIWASGRVRLGTEFNAYEDGTVYLRVPHTRRTVTAVTSISTSSVGSFQKINFNSAPYSAYEITVPVAGNYQVNRPGLYRISTLINFKANSTGYRAAALYIDGVNQFSDRRATNPSGFIALGFTIDWYLTSGQYVSIYAWQNSGAPLELVEAGDECQFSMTFIGLK